MKATKRESLEDVIYSLKYAYATAADNLATVKAENEMLKRKLALCYSAGFTLLNQHNDTVNALRINDAIGGGFRHPLIAFTEYGDLVVCDAQSVQTIDAYEYTVESK